LYVRLQRVISESQAIDCGADAARLTAVLGVAADCALVMTHALHVEFRPRAEVHFLRRRLAGIPGDRCAARTRATPVARRARRLPLSGRRNDVALTRPLRVTPPTRAAPQDGYNPPLFLEREPR
jgi:hypothetical protein